jgi:hypothetical protein
MMEFFFGYYLVPSLFEFEGELMMEEKRRKENEWWLNDSKIPRNIEKGKRVVERASSFFLSYSTLGL